MATTTIKSNSSISKLRLNKKFMLIVAEKLSESIADMAITVIVTMLAMVWMLAFVNPFLVHLVDGYFIAGMLMQLLIRIVRRFDEEYTVRELATQINRVEDEIDQRLERNDIH